QAPRARPLGESPRTRDGLPTDGSRGGQVLRRPVPRLRPLGDAEDEGPPRARQWRQRRRRPEGRRHPVLISSHTTEPSRAPGARALGARPAEEREVIPLKKTVDSRIWKDERFRALGDQGKLLFLHLLTHPGLTRLGTVRTTLGELASALG